MIRDRRFLYPLLLLVAAVPGLAFAQGAGIAGVEREGLVVQVLQDRIIVDIGSADGVLPGNAARILSAARNRATVGTSQVGEVAEAMCQVPLGEIDPDRLQVGDIVMITVGASEEPTENAGLVDRPALSSKVSALSADRRDDARRTRSRVAHEPLRDLAGGEKAMVTLVAIGVDLDEVTLHVRASRRQSYRSVAMARTGDAGWTVTLVQAPRLEYYVEGLVSDGRAVPLFRSASKPWSVAVRDLVDTSIRRVRLGGSFEWQEFYLAHPGRDAFWRTSVDFSYRLGKGALHELRGGVGVMEGIGGSRLEVEDGRSLDHRALAWLYFEPMLRFGDWVRMYPRVMIGGFIDFIDRDYDSWIKAPERGSAMFGTSLHLEIGREHGFMFRFGGTVMQAVGGELDGQITFEPVRGVPIGLSVAATNLPVGDQWGARVQLLAGYRTLDWLTIDVRLGANVRSTRHAGVGGGLGLSFAW